MFFGIIILVVIIMMGYFDTSTLPVGMTKDIFVYGNDPGSGSVYVCHGTVTPGGLRGAIIAWTDGILQSWKTVYSGS